MTQDTATGMPRSDDVWPRVQLDHSWVHAHPSAVVHPDLPSDIRGA
jgi:hypothetical protein